MPRIKMPSPVLIALTVMPAIAIGATLWIVGDLVPACEIDEHQRLTSPDNQFDLVTFSRVCGETPPNTQAALVPPGEEIPFDAASFYSVGANADLAPRWLAYDSIEITGPEDAEIFRNDPAVAGITVTYR